jgi:hypothetical protein
MMFDLNGKRGEYIMTKKPLGRQVDVRTCSTNKYYVEMGVGLFLDSISCVTTKRR